MNDKNTEYLVKTYPDLYKFRKYFACNDGWFKIIDDLSAKLTKEIELEGGELHCFDVKEKYGTLRYYMDGETPKISVLIDKAEGESAKTCEMCGKQGKLRGTAWVSILCDGCMEK